MTPDGRIVVRLPGERPRVRIRDGGQIYEVPAVPHRVLVSTIEMGVSVVWHAGWPTARPMPARMAREGDTTALLTEGIDVVVDEHRVAPLGEQP